MLTTTLLQRYRLVRSADPEELLASLCSTYRLARIKSVPAVGLDRINELRGIRETLFSIGIIDSGFGVQLAGSPMASSYYVHLGVSGTVQCGRNEERILNTPAIAAVANPGDTQLLVPEPTGAATLGIRLDRRLVEQTLASLLGRPLDGPVQFDFALDLSAPANAGLRLVVDNMLGQLDSEHELLQHSAARLAQMRTFVVNLLLTHRHNFSAALTDSGTPLRPRPLRRALDYIGSHLAEPITLADLALVAGCSARTLNDAFREQLCVTPMTHIRRLRLDQVREELLASSESVSDTAWRWGFTHLGRFASAYHERFGELPSETVRRH
jgi:AraC-like DNA-binding protein